MLEKRVIPLLLLDEGGLVKGQAFRNHQYVGDPINTVRIFNEKFVDELIIVDRSAYEHGINFKLLNEIAGEAFMPLAYGGGVTSMDDFRALFALGVEKVMVNSACHSNPGLIAAAAAEFGRQSVVCAIDVRRTLFGGYDVLVDNASTKVKASPIEHAQAMESLGAGEIIVTSINEEGSRKGPDVKAFRGICSAVSIPVVVAGGVGSFDDILNLTALPSVSGVGVGAHFTFYGKHRAVLISYLDEAELKIIREQNL